jgi:NAD(P)-dependent dehydrogenase (short-subunit alcohol dehydrogenase family)
MIARGDGRFLFLGSGAARSDEVVQLPYSVSKLGIERLATGLAHQFTPSGIAVTCIRIDGVMPTEAVAISAPHLAGAGVCSPDDFGEAAAWVVSSPTWFSGAVLTLGQLRDLGGSRLGEHCRRGRGGRPRQITRRTAS